MVVSLRWLLLCCLTVVAVAVAVEGAQPMWNEVLMTQQEIAQCSTCNGAADSAGSAVVANHVRAHLKKFSVPVILKQQDISVTKRFPDRQVKGGCTRPGYARDISVNVKMTEASESLDRYIMDWDEYVNDVFVKGEVKHVVTATMDYESVWRLDLPFGVCKKFAQKTCHDIVGKSYGKNLITITLEASKVIIRTINGVNAITFHLDVKVLSRVEKPTYDPVKVVSTNSCKASFMGITIRDLSQYSRNYAQKCWDSMESEIVELRGTRLLTELQNVLQAKLGEKVSVPIKMHGASTYEFASRVYSGCQPMKCPPGKKLRPMGTTKLCRTRASITKLDCVKLYGATAKLFEKKLGSDSLYYCHVPMIPV